MNGRRTTIVAVLLACLAWAPGHSVAQEGQSAPVSPTVPATRDADALVAKVQAFYDQVTDYSASFRQVVKRRSPRRTFTRSGTVYFKKPGMMRWDYKVPDQVHYVSDGRVLWSYDVAEGVVFRMPVAGSELFQALGFLTGTARLSEVFEAGTGEPVDGGLVPVRLVPKDGAANYRAVTLFVDPATGETRRTEVEDPVGNLSHLWFDDPSFKSLPAKGFDFKVPAGVRVEEIGSE